MSTASHPIAPRPAVSALDRFGFTLFVALAVHAIVLLGLGFKEEKPPQVAQTLEVTLAQYRSDKAPEQADFIAQQNQQGSGDSKQKKLPTTVDRAIFQANDTKRVAAQQLPTPDNQSKPEPVPVTVDQPKPAPVPTPDKATTPAPKKQQVVATQAKKSPQQAPVKQQQQAATPPKPTTGQATSLLARSLEIASLEAKLDTQMQALVNEPRVRRLYSASTKESYDAAYLESWRRKVERVGNLNYPEEAQRRQLYGQLRLLVVIKPDGSLKKVEVLRSSGHKVLDDAAMRIVHLAAPYAPFPPEIRKRADLVEIIRTWRFERARFNVNG